MEWIYLILAIIFEVTGTTLMKLSNGLTKLLPSIGMFISYVICFSILPLSLKKLPISLVYATWSSFGIVIIAIIGVLVFKESYNALKIVSILLTVCGVIGLNMSGAGH